MLDLLAGRERPVQEIAEHFDFSLQAVSQHLGVLADAGLVTRRKEGRYRYYRADPGPLEEVYDWVSGHRRFWSESLDRLGRHLEREL